MKLQALIASLVTGVLVLGLTAQAAPKHKAKKAPAKKAAPQNATEKPTEPGAAPAPAAGKSKLSKDISFSGANVDGKYLSAGESIAEIEGDKDMGALIGIRKNFHDRLSLETARLQAQTSPSATSGKGQ